MARKQHRDCTRYWNRLMRSETLVSYRQRSRVIGRYWKNMYIPGWICYHVSESNRKQGQHSPSRFLLYLVFLFLSLPLNEFQPASFPFLFSISIFGSFIPSRFSYLFFLACLVQNRLSSSVFACRSFPFPMPYIYNPPYPLYHILQISRVC